MTAFFKIVSRDKKTQARTGVLKTSHGEIKTPLFVPVGTQGTVKSLNPQDLNTIGAQIFLSNTYHLYLRPSAEVVKKLGGLHKFMGWNKPLMTDSGGFQVFSLAQEKAQTENGVALVRIDDDGVNFHSHLDGSSHRFTPEKSIEIQQKLGADIILAFDECPAYGVSKEKVKRATDRTHKWALRSLKAAQGKLTKSKQLLFGIVQGGVFKNLREESAKFISDFAVKRNGFDGIAIGGVAVGESKKEMVEVLNWVIPHLPGEKPRHLLGVGEVDDIFASVERGIDMFDCVLPTRLGRMGHLLCNNKKLAVSNRQRFRVDIEKAVFAKDPRPPVEDCACYTCQNFSRAYLNHLFRARELLAYYLATYHNLYFMVDLMRQIREAITGGEFGKLKKKWLG